MKNGRKALSKQSSLHAKGKPGQKQMRPDKGMLGLNSALKAKGVAKQKRGRKAKQAALVRVVDKAAQQSQQIGAQHISMETSLHAEDIPEAKAFANEVVTQTEKFPAKLLHGNKGRHHARKRPAADTLGRKGGSYSQQAPSADAAKAPGKSSPPRAKQAPAAQAQGKERVSQTVPGPGEATPGRQAKRSAAELALADQEITVAGQVAAEELAKEARERPKHSATKADQQDTPSGQLPRPAASQNRRSKQPAAGPAQKACKTVQAPPHGSLRRKKRKKPAADPCLPDQEIPLAKQAPAAQLPHKRNAKEPAAKQNHANGKVCDQMHNSYWHPCLSACMSHSIPAHETGTEKTGDVDQTWSEPTCICVSGTVMARHCDCLCMGARLVTCSRAVCRWGRAMPSRRPGRRGSQERGGRAWPSPACWAASTSTSVSGMRLTSRGSGG